jgi:hypothetical protein
VRNGAFGTGECSVNNVRVTETPYVRAKNCHYYGGGSYLGTIQEHGRPTNGQSITTASIPTPANNREEKRETTNGVTTRPRLLAAEKEGRR